MTRDRDRIVVTGQQMRPSTSAGTRFSLFPRPFDVKCDAAGPEDASASELMPLAKQGQPKKVKKKKKPMASTRQQEPPETPSTAQQELIDGFRHVTAALRADERQLHEQLLVASEKGNYRAIYLLLHQNLVDKDRCLGMRGYSPLHHAAARGHLEALQLLLDFGWGVDTRNDSLETPLHLASYGGHARLVEGLLDRGADIDARTRELETPLFYAARKGHDRIVLLLVRHECDLEARNRYGDVAEDEAADDKTRQEFEAANQDAERIRSGPHTSSELVTDERVLSQQVRERVLSFLDVHSLCRASQVAFRWHRAADNPVLWRKLGVSRWELQLNSSLGLGTSALGTLAMLTARRSGVRTSTAASSNPMSFGKTASALRPASCDQVASRFLLPRIPIRHTARDDARPQTARNL